MQIVATFELTTFLEMAISELKRNGIHDVFAVPLDARRASPRLIDSLHQADGRSFIDRGMILAYIFATIGASKGFVWEWGPVIWGLIGAAAGLLLGVLLNVIVYKLRHGGPGGARRKGMRGEVVLVVTCPEELSGLAENILWDHFALGLAKTN